VTFKFKFGHHWQVRLPVTVAGQVGVTVSGPSITQAGQALTQAVTARAAAARGTGDQASESGDRRPSHAGRDRDAGRAVRWAEPDTLPESAPL
jgi:hypothetical protein